jgi:hypothetical protein
MWQLAITQIGERLFQCSEACTGVVHDAAAGILPRVPIIERAECHGCGCLVAGVNPCRSDPHERAFYREKGPSSETVTAYWRQNVDQVVYYRRLRQFLALLDLQGPIIWSNLVKCESAPEVKRSLPVQTLRVCAGHFLLKEVEETPKDWPVFGLGKEAYKALAYCEPARTVIGIPHPTASPGQFRELFVNGRPEINRLRNHVTVAMAAALTALTPIAVWIA